MPKALRRQGVSHGGTASALSKYMALLTVPSCRGLFDGDRSDDQYPAGPEVDAIESLPKSNSQASTVL